jgi:predicted Zn-dependent protease
MSSDAQFPGGLGQRAVQLVGALLVGAVAIGFVMVKGCQEGPFGRKQFVALNPEQEKVLGAQAYQEVLSKSDLVTGGPVVQEVERVTRRLTRATTRADFLRATKMQPRNFDWEVQVVRSRQVNAFCLPGGKMVVYTAILPVCQTDAGLATVMAHEIAHALARHGAERMAHQKIAEIGVQAAGSSLGGLDPGERQRVMQVLNAGAQFGILKYGRGHESEADHVGLLLMAAAGYDPNEAVKFWERMSRLGGKSKTPEFLSTHPSHETRVRDLLRWMPQAMPLYKASGDAQPPRKLTLES